MTAFARAAQSSETKLTTVEIKSVNNRYLDCSVKISRVFSFLEDRVRKYIAECGINRGKVDVFISVDITENTSSMLSLDKAYASSYIAALHELRDTFSLKDDISVMTVAQNRDIFSERKTAEDADAAWLEVKPVLDRAIEAFLKMRESEGEKLKRDILAKLEGIELIKSKIETLSEEDIKTYRERFEAKLRQIIGENGIVLNEQLIITECAVYADRVAIDEELVRLGCHFNAFREIMNTGGQVGRKLDFLLQEINREINTTGSKCSNTTIASLVVEAKSELEKIREQIQNIE